MSRRRRHRADSASTRDHAAARIGFPRRRRSEVLGGRVRAVLTARSGDRRATARPRRYPAPRCIALTKTCRIATPASTADASAATSSTAAATSSTSTSAAATLGERGRDREGDHRHGDHERTERSHLDVASCAPLHARIGLDAAANGLSSPRPPLNGRNSSATLRAKRASTDQVPDSAAEDGRSGAQTVQSGVGGTSVRVTKCGSDAVFARSSGAAQPPEARFR